MASKPFAMILAAGLGTRLNPLCHHLPKPALELCGKPNIYHQLQMLINAGIEDVAINIHHKPEILTKILDDFNGQINIHILYEKYILGTGGGIKNAINSLNIKDKNLLILQGDIVIDFDLKELFDLNNFCTLVCIKEKTIEGYFSNIGVDQSGNITDLGRYYKSLRPHLMRGFFSGVHLLSPQAVFLVSKNLSSGLVDEIYPQWLNENKSIKGLMIETFYDDLGSPKRLLNTNLNALKNSNNFKNINLFSGLDKIYKHSFIDKSSTVSKKVKLIEPFLISKEAYIEDDTTIGPFAVIGSHAFIKKGAHVEKSVIMQKTSIEKNEKILSSIALMNERMVL